MIIKTFKFRIYPSRSQAKSLESIVETCRRFYNSCLEERKTAYEERKESIGVFAQLRRVKIGKENNEYAKNIHSHVLQVVVQDLDKSFRAFFRRVKAGETPGYPRFKGRNRFDSFGLKEYGNGFKLDGRRLKLSGVGRIRVMWHREITGKIKTLRVVRAARKWYACFACECEENILEKTGLQVGVDVGIKSLVSLSDGETIENPKWYRESQKELRVAQRRVSRRIKGGSNRRKAISILQTKHTKTTNQRKDYLNKIAHYLVGKYDLIGLEDLQITNMVRNHLSKSIMDAGWGYLKLQLTHKAAEAGRELILVNPSYTSKTCSNCGFVFENFTLADRWVECECGLSMDRDVNAAKNILKRAGQVRWGLTYPSRESVPQEATAL